MRDRLRTWGSRVWSWMRTAHVDREFTEELESHTGLLIEDNLRRGLAPDEARRQALLHLGGIAQLRERNREQRGLPLLDRLALDIRHAARVFAKAPGFTLFAGGALALGIGATTAVFSVADAALLRPLPYREPSRLVTVWQDDTAFGFPRNNSNPWTFQQWQQRNHAFEDMAPVSHGSANLTGTGEPEYLQANTVTANLFRLLGEAPAAGPPFSDDDGRAGQPLTVVLSYGLWVRRFAADPKTVGQDLVLNGAKYSVIGVMPRGFQFIDPEIELWVPAQWTPELIETRKFDHFLTIVARLRSGISLRQAAADMSVAAAQLAPANVTDPGAVLVPLREQLAGDVSTATA